MLNVTISGLEESLSRSLAVIPKHFIMEINDHFLSTIKKYGPVLIRFCYLTR